MRRAATALGILAADMPAVEFRNFARASLEGARTVMLEAPPNADTKAGWVESRASKSLMRASRIEVKVGTYY